MPSTTRSLGKLAPAVRNTKTTQLPETPQEEIQQDVKETAVQKTPVKSTNRMHS